MANEHSSHKPQNRALYQCSAELVTALSAADPSFSWQLLSKELIGLEVVDYCQLEVTQTKKSSKIVHAVITAVSASPHLFESLVSILSESGNTALMSVGEKLQQTYEKLLTVTPHPPLEPIYSHNTPLQPICCYADYLRAIYKRSELPEYSDPTCYKWTSSLGKKFINLAVISKKELSKAEADKIKKEAIHGHIDLILKKKESIAFENILQVEKKQSLTCVLIEGAPGVGKSMLAWEICRRWGRQELFKEYSIVLLVTLRDERVQKAANVEDLFYHSEKKLQADVVQEIKRNNGKRTLILLEGLDELPRYLLTGRSLFTDLLSGAIFPEATVLVTSRPSATDKLWQRGWQTKSRHIEILGFTDNNIDEYSESVLSDEQLPGFKSYLSIHPHIKSMMYVPLHCVIVLAVYLKCQQSDRRPPKTITELYTCLAETILMQYLQDHSDYKGINYEINNFSELPAPVYAHFKRLCGLAFYGVDKQQLIFHNLPQSLSMDAFQQFEHLGFMNAKPEHSLLSQQSASYSYNFLHLSVQEYLAAYHVSLMSHHEQEQLLQTVRYGDHRFDMVRFLAGLTQLKYLSKELVKNVIGIRSRGCRETEAEVSEYALEFLYECQDVSILDTMCSYHVRIQSTDSVHCLMALGYSIARSSSKWYVRFSDRGNSGTDILHHSLKENSHPKYSIETVEYSNCTPDFTHQVLQNLPVYALKQIKNISIQHDDAQPLPPCFPEIIPGMENTLTLSSIYTSRFQFGYKKNQDNCQPLPSSLPKLIPRMEKLDSLTLENVLDTSLTELIPALSRITTLRNLHIFNVRNNFKMQFSDEDTCTSTSTIESYKLAPEFLDQLLPALPQQTIADTELLKIEYEYYQHQPLPSCLPELILGMERLNTLTLVNALDASLMPIENMLDTSIMTLENVFDISLKELIPVLSTIITLRNLYICNGRRTFKMLFSTEDHTCLSISSIESNNLTSEFLDQLLPSLPQQVIAGTKLFKIKYEEYYYHQPLPSCLPELILRMERLNTLTLENISLVPLENVTSLITAENDFDTSLQELIPALSRITTLRKLYILNGRNSFEMQFSVKDTCTPTGTIESNNLTPEFLDQLLLALPQHYIAGTESLKIEYEEYYHYQSLPSCLPELILKMERLHTLILENVLDTSIMTLENVLYTSLTELMPALFKVTTLRKLYIFNGKKNFEMQFSTEGNSAGTIESNNLTSEFLNQLLLALPQQNIAGTELLKIEYEENEYDYHQLLPPCLPELVSKMESLNTLTLKNVRNASLAELIPALSRVPNLRNLHIRNVRCEFMMQFSTCMSTGTIESNNLTSEFLNQLLSSLSKQNIAGTVLLKIKYEKDECNHHKPLPSCLYELIPRMERLNSLALMNASLTELIPALSKITTLRNLMLYRLNSEGIALLCDWLPTCRLETLILSFLSSEQLEMVSRSLIAVSSLKRLTIHRSECTFHAMQAFESMLQQNQSLTELNINNCNVDRDSICCLVEALGHDITLRKLDMSKNLIGEREALAMAEMLKRSTTLIELSFSQAEISINGAVAMAKILHFNTTLRILDVSGNTVSERGALTMAEILKGNTRLEELKISKAEINVNGAVAMAEALCHNKTLRKLDMSENSVGERGALTMADMLEQNTTLEELQFSKAEISVNGTVVIAEVLYHNTALRKLDMSENSVGQRGALTVAEMLKHNTTLEELNLHDTEISRDGTFALAKVLNHNTTLRKLDMGFNIVGKRGGVAFAEMMKNNTTLESFTFGLFSDSTMKEMKLLLGDISRKVDFQTTAGRSMQLARQTWQHSDTEK